MPTTFKDLKVDNITDQELLTVAKLSTSADDTMTEMPFKVTADDVVQAMKAANAYSLYYQQRNQL